MTGSWLFGFGCFMTGFCLGFVSVFFVGKRFVRYVSVNYPNITIDVGQHEKANETVED